MTTFITYPAITTLNITSNPVTTLWMYGDTVSGGYAGPVSLLLTMIICYIALAQSPYQDKSMVTTAWLGFLVAMLMYGAGILHPFYVIGSLAFLGLTLYLSGRWHG